MNRIPALSLTADDVLARVAEGDCYSECSVEGYWSDPITLKVDRPFCMDPDVTRYSIEVTHSSGGYERDFDTVLANENLAHALLHTCRVASELRLRHDDVLAAFAAYKDKLKRAAERAEAVRLAALEADPPMTSYAAEALIAKAVAEAASKATEYVDGEASFTVRRAGCSDDTFTYYAVVAGSRTTFFQSERRRDRISKRDLIDTLTRAFTTADKPTNVNA